MRRSKTILRFGMLAGLLVIAAISAQPLPAGFSVGTTQMHVVIDGVDFGTFDKPKGMENWQFEGSLSSSSLVSDKEFHRITLKRDFVTDKSLYLWAANSKETPSNVRDVRLVLKSSSGQELNRYTLKFCQPLAWSVEAANPALGGFHESVDLAVQDIVAE